MSSNLANHSFLYFGILKLFLIPFHKIHKMKKKKMMENYTGNSPKIFLHLQP